MSQIHTYFQIERSKNLLVEFLSSDSTIELIGIQYSSDIVTFLRQFVFPNEDYFASFHYQNIRCFDEYSNTPLEGTNNGLKHCTLAVKGNMTIQQASLYMLQQDSDKQLANDMDLHCDLHKSRLCNLNTCSVRYISKKAAGQLMLQVQNLQNYASIRTGPTTWNVLRSTSQTYEKKIIPVFERMRCVNWNCDKTLSCDCGYTERWGMPCRHMAHVVEFYSDQKCFFTHQDVDIRWWDVYTKIVVAMEMENINCEEKILREKLKLIKEVQRYPVVNNIHGFNGIMYKYGKNSSEKFNSVAIETIEELFRKKKNGLY